MTKEYGKQNVTMRGGVAYYPESPPTDNKTTTKPIIPGVTPEKEKDPAAEVISDTVPEAETFDEDEKK